MIHKCERCGYETSNLGSYKKHLQRKYPCILKPSEPESETNEDDDILERHRETYEQIKDTVHEGLMGCLTDSYVEALRTGLEHKITELTNILNILNKTRPPIISSDVNE